MLNFRKTLYDRENNGFMKKSWKKIYCGWTIGRNLLQKREDRAKLRKQQKTNGFLLKFS